MVSTFILQLHKEIQGLRLFSLYYSLSEINIGEQKIYIFIENYA